MDRQKKAYLFGIATVLLWSTVASAFKLSLRHLDPLHLLLFADMVSIMVLFAVILLSGRTEKLFSLSRKDLLFCGALGFLNPFLYYVILFQAYDLLPAQEAQPLNYTWAITLTLLSIPMLGQKISAKDLAAIFVSYFGVVVISTQGDPFSFRFGNPTGAAFALGSTIIWALYWIYNTKNSLDSVISLFLNFLFGLPFIAVAVIFFSPPFSLTTPGILGAVYVGVFEMGITFVLWINALRLSDSAAKVGNLIFFSPFLSLVFIHFFVGEKILASTVFGLFFIISGNILQKLEFRQKSRNG